MIIRAATLEDAAAILAIYTPNVDETAISFEERHPTLEEMAARMDTGYPWLVAEQSGTVVGYAYASLHRGRAAYRWSVDVSVYVASGSHGKGIGRSLYKNLLGLLVELGYYKAFAGITQPNEASVKLHESMGFRLVGVYHGVGFKFGRWHDVAWFEKMLRPEDDRPVDPEGYRNADQSS